jgi:hypothetical protein
LEWPSNNESFSRPSLTDAQISGLEGSSAGKNAAEVAHARWQQYDTKYDNTGKRHQLWRHADCSSFVWGGFADPIIDPDSPDTAVNRNSGMSMAEKLGWPSFNAGITGGSYIPDTSTMKDTFSNHPLVTPIWGFNMAQGELDGARVFDIIVRECQKGDILLRVNHPDRDKGHVAFFWEADNDDKWFKVLHASDPEGDVKFTTYSERSIQYNYGARVFGTAGNHIGDVDQDAVYGGST